MDLRKSKDPISISLYRKKKKREKSLHEGDESQGVSRVASSSSLQAFIVSSMPFC